MIWWLLACPAPECADLCEQALDRQLSCMEERGLDWKTSVYVDEADFNNGCATWVWEVTQLGLDQCSAMQTAILEGTCDDFDAAWHF